jgi:hypothetical protein
MRRRRRMGWIVFPSVEDGVLGASAIFLGWHPVDSFEGLEGI